jgi:hypothetical protein
MAMKSDTFLESLVGDLRPVRPLHQRTGMALALLALAAGAALIAFLWGWRSDLTGGQPDPMFLTSTGLFLVLSLASAWAVIDMARPWVGTRRDGWGWTALMAAVLPIAALALLAADWLRGRTLALDPGGYACLSFGSIIGLLTAATLVFWLRKGAPSTPRRAGLLTGVAAGSAGIFAVSLACPHSDLMHIGIWHGMTVILTGLLGLLTIPRLIRW